MITNSRPWLVLFSMVLELSLIPPVPEFRVDRVMNDCTADGIWKHDPTRISKSRVLAFSSLSVVQGGLQLANSKPLLHLYNSRWR
ncbi:hypothetical protein BDP55DRAFT_676762 [Colletotrichum godetiae]|uniref:Secreted protein n=1 Tax=Colletotrichum godetiae TaxID=1209918 RepID=A0AAJ0AC63_9PEZI|nr:uncharacterized protein BDP55DRAFT_676762 [Colletotrichum godetiae]KAK1671223.1 hypothetical protein BDP55DRAFT_676762 [Colletotrichum godetiae]